MSTLSPHTKRRTQPRAPRRIHAAALLALFALVPPAHAGLGQFSLRTFASADGLPSDHVTALMQDSRGYLWIGTDNGIALYDGVVFRTLGTVEGLENLYVVRLLESRTNPGTVYAGTIAGGVFRYRDGEFRKVYDSPVLKERFVRSIVEQADGGVWIGTGGGSVLLRGDTVAGRWPASDTVNGVIMAPAASGGVYSVDGAALLHPADGRLLRTELPLRTGGGAVALMAGDGRGAAWLWTTDSLLIRVHKGRVDRAVRVGFQAAWITPVGDSLLWLSGRSEVVLVDARTLGERSRIGRGAGIPDQIIGPVLVDREGSLWIGTWQDGLHRLTRPWFTFVPLSEGDPADRPVHAVYDPRGVFWISTRQGIIEVRKDSAAWRRRLHPLPGAGIGRGMLALDSAGLLYLTQGGDTTLLLFDPVRRRGGGWDVRMRRILRSADLAGAEWVVRVDAGRSGRVFLSAVPQGLQVRESGSLRLLRTVTVQLGAPGGSLRAVYEDRHGRLWMGDFAAGLAVLDSAGLLPRHLGQPEGLPDPGIRSIAEDVDGRLWVGTRYGGVAQWDGVRFAAVSQRDGLRSNVGWAMTADSAGTLWVGTSSGLERIDTRSRKVLPAIPELMGEPVSACGMLEGGTVWALTPRRLLFFEAASEQPNLAPPLVHMTGLSVNGGERPLAGGEEFGPDQNTILVEYVGVSLRGEGGVRYAHRIGGGESAWSAPSAERSVLLAGLPPGRHTFEVKAINADGVESLAPASVTFTIVPPVWRRWWFVSLSALSILALLGVAVRYVATQELRRKIALLEREKAVEAERAATRDRIARDLHDEVASTLASIALYAEALKRPAAGGDGAPPDTLDRIEALTQEAEESMGDIIWSTSPSHDRLADLAARIRRDALDLCGPKGIRVTIDMPEAMPDRKLKDDVRKSFYLVAKEALNNAVKHSRAKEVRVLLRLEEGVLRLSVADDGGGIAAGQGKDGVRGHGMRNMRRRAEEASARLEVESRDGEGTTITLVAAMT
jgi:signal transduction histidine kinase/ligand-binding sensor domain-containing protein